MANWIEFFFDLITIKGDSEILAKTYKPQERTTGNTAEQPTASKDSRERTSLVEKPDQEKNKHDAGLI